MFSFSLEELTLLGLFLVALEIAGVILAIDAILNSRTSQGAIAWALSLVTAPYLALPLYAFFGRRKLEGYEQSRRQRGVTINQATLHLETRLLPFQKKSINGGKK